MLVPDVLGDVGAAHHFPGAACQVLEQRELLRGEVTSAPRLPDAARRQIDPRGPRRGAARWPAAGARAE